MWPSVVDSTPCDWIKVIKEKGKAGKLYLIMEMVDSTPQIIEIVLYVSEGITSKYQEVKSLGPNNMVTSTN
jgi:hypothetical protein